MWNTDKSKPWLNGAHPEYGPAKAAQDGMKKFLDSSGAKPGDFATGIGVTADNQRASIRVLVFSGEKRVLDMAALIPPVFDGHEVQVDHVGPVSPL